MDRDKRIVGHPYTRSTPGSRSQTPNPFGVDNPSGLRTMSTFSEGSSMQPQMQGIEGLDQSNPMTAILIEIHTKIAVLESKELTNEMHAQCFEQEIERIERQTDAHHATMQQTLATVNMS